MLADNMYAFRGQLQEQGVVFCYSGYMTEEVLTGIGNAIKKMMELEETDRMVAKDIFSIFVEQVQNVIRYSAEHVPPKIIGQEKELRYGVLTVGYKDGRYFVSCGNLVRQEDVARLKSSLGHIKALDKDGLKALYKETLKGEAPKRSKGAGVGFVDIARRAVHGFEFDFSGVDDNYSYFCLTAYV